MSLSDIATIREIMRQNNLRFQKSLGQNFLCDPSVAPRIVARSGIDSTCGVLEIGPGIGSLTEHLCQAAARVVAVELDGRLLPVLQKTVGRFDNVRIIQDDILKTDIESIIRSDFSGLTSHVCANLPYYITTPVVMALLERRLSIRRITVMVQREVALRLCAPPGSRDCGAVSYAVSYYSEPEYLFDVPADAFYPQPKVGSAVISLKILERPSVSPQNEKHMFLLIKGAFLQRRKTLINALSGVGERKEEVARALSDLCLPPDIRGERLTLSDFSRLSDILPGGNPK